MNCWYEIVDSYTNRSFGGSTFFSNHEAKVFETLDEAKVEFERLCLNGYGNIYYRKNGRINLSTPQFAAVIASRLKITCKSYKDLKLQTQIIHCKLTDKCDWKITKQKPRIFKYSKPGEAFEAYEANNLINPGIKGHNIFLLGKMNNQFYSVQLYSATIKNIDKSKKDEIVVGYFICKECEEIFDKAVVDNMMINVRTKEMTRETKV